MEKEEEDKSKFLKKVLFVDAKMNVSGKRIVYEKEVVRRRGKPSNGRSTTACTTLR